MAIKLSEINEGDLIAFKDNYVEAEGVVVKSEYGLAIQWDVGFMPTYIQHWKPSELKYLYKLNYKKTPLYKLLNGE